MPFAPLASHSARLALLLVAASLAACNDDDTLPAEDDDHDDAHVETSGRLVIGEAGLPTVYVHDLDEGMTIASFTLDHPASAVHASPDRRYAVVPQREDDLTQFVDGGIWQEDHGDHLHDYVADPLLLAMTLDGVRPTHYEAHDELSALFFDGNAALGATAGVAVLSDASITNGLTEAELSLPVAMHGTAEPRGDFLLTTYRAPDAATTLPSAVDLYVRNGSGYDFVEQFAEPCPDLHGSFSNEDYTAFGCGDGVLIVAQDDDTFTASKILNDGVPEGSRIGTLVGHHDLAGFGGFAGSALFAIDPEAGTMQAVDWTGGAAVSGVAYAMDAHGENFLILDSAGALHFLSPGDGWSTSGSVAVIDSLLEDQAPRIAVSHAEEVAFVTDPAAQELIVVDLESQSVLQRVALGYTPMGLTWLGLAEHEHDH